MTDTTPMHRREEVMTAHQQVMAHLVGAHERVMLAWMGFDQATKPLAPSPAARPAPLSEPRGLAPPAAEPSAAPPPAPSPPTAKVPGAPYVPPAVVAPHVTDNGTPGRDELTRVLIDTISERTGYPADVVGLDTDLQADLGIDSIKKVEILGTFQRHFGLRNGVAPSAMQELAAVKTPRAAVDVVAELLLGSVAQSERPPGNAADLLVGGPARFLPVAGEGL